MAKYIMLPEERIAICDKLEEIYETASAKEISAAYEMLDKKGIPNGAFQNYHLLSLMLDLQSKIIAVKKNMEARYNG